MSYFFAVDRLQKWLLHAIGLLVFLPFSYYEGTDPVTTFYGEWLAFVAGIMLVGLYLSCLWQKPFLFPKIALLPLGLVVIIGLQMIKGLSPVMAYAQTGILYLLWSALIMAAAHQAVKLHGLAKLADYMAWYLVVGGIWNVLLEINHFENLHLFAQNYPELFGMGTIGQPNQICAYLFFSCCSLIYLYSSNLLGPRVFAVCVLLFTAELGLSTSRSGMLYLFACGGLLFFWRNMDNQADLKRLRNGYLIFALLYIAWELIYPLFGHATGAFRMATAASNSSSLERVFIWKDAWAIFLQSPWLGVGFGEFDWAFFLHGKIHSHAVINNRVEHAHNLFLHLLAEMGLAGFLLIMIIGGLWLLQLLQTKRDSSSWWFFVLLSILGINSMLEYPFWLSNFLGVFAVLLGAGENRSVEIKLSKITYLALAGVPVLGLFLLVNTGLSYLKLEKFSEAVRLSKPYPGNPEEIIPLSNGGLLAPFGLQYFAFMFKFDSAQSSEKAAITEKAMHFEPTPPSVYKQAVYLAYTGNRQEARELLHLAISNYPRELTWFLSQVNALSQADQDKLAFLLADQPGITAKTP